MASKGRGGGYGIPSYLAVLTWEGEVCVAVLTWKGSVAPSEDGSVMPS